MALTVAQLVARVTADTSGFYRGMAIANSSMIRSGSIISRVAAGAGLATLGMGIMSLRAAGNFEESMNILQAVANPTVQQFEDLRDQAIALGADLKLPNVSAKDAANAMQELAKGGLSVDQILESTRGTLQLGLAANTDFATSAVIVARALKAFNLRGTEATTVADLFAAAANKSTAEMTDIALGFQMASAQFAAGDQTIQALTTSLAIMADAGVVGSDAGTSLKTMMNRLMAPTKKAKDLMKDLGFAVYDSSGNMKEMPDIIGSLQESLAGMSKEQRNATLYTIFGSDAIRAARIMLNEGERGWRNYEKSITKGGEAQRITEARTKGLNGAMQAFGSAVETQAIILGTALLPAATSVTRAMTRFIMAIDPNKIIGFFSAIKDGIVWFKDFVQVSDTAQFVLAGLAGAMTGLFVGYELVKMFRAIQIAWMLLNASLIASPVGLVALAIGALIGALVLAYFKVEKFREIVDSTFNWLKTNIPPIVEAVSKAIRAHWDDIVAYARFVGRFLQTWWNLTWAQILAFTRENWDKIKAVIFAVLGNIEIQVRSAMNIIRGAINLIMGIIRGDWGRAWEGIKQIVDGVLGGIIRLIINTLTRIVPSVLRLALAIGMAIVRGILNGVKTLASALLSSAKTLIASAVTGIASWASGVAASIGRAIVDGILSGVTSLPGALKDKLVGGISSAFSAATGFLQSGSPSKKAADMIGKPIADGVILGWLQGTRDLPTKIKDSLRNALEAGKQVVESYQQQLSASFSQLAEDVFAAFDAQTQAFQTKAEKALAAFDAKQTKKEMQKEMQDLRATLQEEQKKLAEMKAPEAVQQEGETEEQFRARAQREMQEYIDARNEQVERVAAAEQAIEDELESRRIAAQRERLAKEAERSRTRYEERRRLERRRMEQQLADLEEQLSKHPEQWDKIQGKIIAVLASHGIRYRKAGHRLGNLYARGILDSVDAIREAAGELATAIERLLKLGSPAKEGPLSDLHKWWRPFGDTLVSGIDTHPIRSAAAAMAGMPSAHVGASGLGASVGAAASSLAAQPSVTIVVQGSLIHERELDERIREGVLNQGLFGRTVVPQ